MDQDNIGERQYIPENPVSPAQSGASWVMQRLGALLSRPSCMIISNGVAF